MEGKNRKMSRINHLLFFGLIWLLMTGCSSSNEQTNQLPLPMKLEQIKRNTIEVNHSVDTVFATVNAKDPEKRGKYQLQVTTSVSSKEADLTIQEFGAYMLENGEWKFSSIFNRPFNKEEFSKWYGCKNGILKKDSVYNDPDNWLAKGDVLTRDTLVSLWYFIGLDNYGNQHLGTRKVVGVFHLK